MPSKTFFHLLIGFALCATAVFAQSSFIGPMKTIKAHTSTVPSNGDVNPYGVAVVPVSTGSLLSGHVLVSNFNDSDNFQGTGTTIVQVAPGEGVSKLFAQISPSTCTEGVGLTTALAVFRSGFVIVGSLPTTDGMSDTAGPGCFIVLNSSGNVVTTFSGAAINGPWDMTAVDMGASGVIFWTNVLDGTVMRATVSFSGTPSMDTPVMIGSGFSHSPDPAALEIGPTGVGLGADGTLYVADNVNSAIQAIPMALTRISNAGTGSNVTTGGSLNGPLGLAIAPNGDIITVNAGDGNMVETTPGGAQVAVKNVDVTGTGGGTLFGLAIEPNNQGIFFVNDGNNTLDDLH